MTSNPRATAIAWIITECRIFPNTYLSVQREHGWREGVPPASDAIKADIWATNHYYNNDGISTTQNGEHEIHSAQPFPEPLWISSNPNSSNNCIITPLHYSTKGLSSPAIESLLSPGQIPNPNTHKQQLLQTRDQNRIRDYNLSPSTHNRLAASTHSISHELFTMTTTLSLSSHKVP
jgi:hypothetical protein